MTIIKSFYLIIIFLFLFISLRLDAKDTKASHIKIFDDINIEINGTTLVLSDKYDRDDYIEITRHHDLYVNGNKVDLDRSQRKLIRHYYDSYFELTEYVEKIGLESAKIGLAGARVGAVAAAKAIKMIFSEYEAEELEDEIEADKELIEELAEELEDKVDEIENMADEFEDLHHQLRHSIPDLQDLGWF